MDQKTAPVEVPHPDDLATEMKKSDNDCSFITNKETCDVSMPICFLVKEQAKSLVAIQDLQRRLENVENIQDDVIDALSEIQNHLFNNNTKSFSGLTSVASNSVNLTKSPSFITSKGTPLSKTRRFSCSPSNLKNVVDVSSILGAKSYALKDCDNLLSEVKRRSASINIPENSHKLFDLAKPKDSTSESDKQDSGLDSDCRELNDINPSLVKHSSNWVKQESNDELLQLLDEISQRSEILQKQLAAVEESPVLDLKKDMSLLHTSHNVHEHINSVPEEKEKPKFTHLKVKNSLSYQKKEFQSRLYTSLIEAHDSDDENVPTNKHNHTCVPPAHSIIEKVSKIRRRTTNKIDSAMVSSILKETNVVELQRQVLIYLVENAVLQTKLSELEQVISSKVSESEKIENSLKDEARLLMMENRELRIGLDEQKLEANALKSKVAMLERVLQSVTVENRELTWQLGESLGLQNLSRRDLPNFSSSYPFGNTSSAANCIKRSSLLPHSSCQNDSNSNCMKSKLLPNTNNFCGVTVDESEPCFTSDIRSPNGAFKYQIGPLQSSTPVMPFIKQKDLKSSSVKNLNISSPGNTSANFHSVKKRLKSANTDKDITLSKSHRSEKCLGENNYPETSAKGLKLPVDDIDALPSSASKFPFNTIIEKLKSNNDYRLSKRIPLVQNDEPYDEQSKPLTYNKTKTVSQMRENIGDESENKVSQGNSQIKSQESSPVNNIHGKKGRNIHQRIQDILDRIMAESEET